MRESNRAYKLLVAISNKGMADTEKLQGWIVSSFQWAMSKADENRFKYDSALADQQDMLIELSLLKASLDLKKDALEDGGFSEEHGPGLEVVANALYEVCLWEDDDVAEWFSQLVLSDDGDHLGFDLEIEE